MKINFVVLLRIFSLFLIFFTIGYYFTIEEMIKHEDPQLYKISSLKCRKKSGSAVGIHYLGKYYSVEVTRENCNNYNLNDSICLYYNEKYDFFYVPDSLYLYKRYIYGSVLLFLFSLLPLSKIQNFIFNYLDEKIKEEDQKINTKRKNQISRK